MAKPVQIDFISVKEAAQRRVDVASKQVELSEAEVKFFEDSKMPSNAKRSKVKLARQRMALALALAELEELKGKS